MLLLTPIDEPTRGVLRQTWTCSRLASAMSCRFYLNGLSLLHGVVIVPLDGWVLVRQPQDPKTWAQWMSSRETIIIQQRTLYYPFGWLCSLAFVCRVGVKCIWGFRWRLPARLGLRRAFELSSLQFVLPAACCLPLFVSRPSSLPSPSSFSSWLSLFVTWFLLVFSV